MEIPQHVAIILDGNGRWAKSQGKPRNFGHIKGAKNVETIIEAASNLGIKYLTLYAFSTENWNRPQDEVDALMKLPRDYLKSCLKTARKNNMRMRVIGDVSRLDPDIQERIRELEEDSAAYDGITVQIAINYGSRDEIRRAITSMAKEAADGKLDPDSITESMIGEYLDTSGIPDPDLMIRTSGELRLSNYLLWQLAYAEFYFTDVPWPAFTEQDLKDAIEAYGGRKRRYGKV